MLCPPGGQIRSASPGGQVHNSHLLVAYSYKISCTYYIHLLVNLDIPAFLVCKNFPILISYHTVYIGSYYIHTGLCGLENVQFIYLTTSSTPTILVVHVLFKTVQRQLFELQQQGNSIDYGTIGQRGPHYLDIPNSRSFSMLSITMSTTIIQVKKVVVMS